jgi:hypothetical protein
MSLQFDHGHSKAAKHCDAFYNQQQLQEAMGLVNKFLSNDTIMVEMCRSAAVLFKADIKDEEIRNVLKNTKQCGYKVYIEAAATMKEAFVKCQPSIGVGLSGVAEAHEIAINKDYMTLQNAGDVEYDNRAVLFLFTKLMYEVVRSITPCLVRLTATYQQQIAQDIAEEPTKIQSRPKIGFGWAENEEGKTTVVPESGAAWEQAALGGRLVLGGAADDPYANPMKLIAVNNSRDSPSTTNYVKLEVPDVVVGNKLLSLRSWSALNKAPDLRLAEHCPQVTGAKRTAEDRSQPGKRTKNAFVERGYCSQDGEDEDSVRSAEEVHSEGADSEHVVEAPPDLQELRELGLVMNRDMYAMRNAGYRF